MEFYRDSHGTVSFRAGYAHDWTQPCHYRSHVVGLVLAVAIFSSVHSLAFVVGIRTFNSYF